MTSERNNPFDLGDLIPLPPKPQPAASEKILQEQPPVRPSRAQIEQLAKETGFVSRERPRMGPRHKTGRNRQLNLKVRDEDLERFYRIADADRITLGEVFEHALDALEAKRRGER